MQKYKKVFGKPTFFFTILQDFYFSFASSWELTVCVPYNFIASCDIFYLVGLQVRIINQKFLINLCLTVLQILCQTS